MPFHSASGRVALVSDANRISRTQCPSGRCNAVTLARVACVIATAACATEPQGSGADPLFQTVGSEATLQQDHARHEWIAEIPFVFRNTIPDTVYIVENCQGNARWQLQRLEGWVWRVVYGPFHADCGGAPLVVAPGAARQDTISVLVGPLHGATMAIAPEDVVGTVRIEWPEVVHDYAGSYPFGARLRQYQRVSNSFVLRVE